MTLVENQIDCLQSDFLSYADAVIKQSNYVNKFCHTYSTDCYRKPLFDPKKYPEFSPDLTQEQINGLKDPDLFTKEELIAILNTLILKYIMWEELIDDAIGRHSYDNTIVPDTEL